MPIAIGTKAPDFTLKTAAADGLKDVTLSANFGKKKTLILVYGISVDSPFAQSAWAKQNKIGVTLLSDLNKKVAADYGVIFPGLAGIGDTSARAAFVIGTDGVVKYAEQTATPKDLPNFAAIKAALAK